jgi:hypothetical protein
MAFGGLELVVAAFGAALVVIEAIPIVLLFAAIGYAIIMLIKHWKAVKEAAVDAMDWVVNAASNAWNWIKEHWPLIGVLLMAPFIAFGVWIVAIPAAIIAALLIALNFIKQHFPGLYKVLIWPFQEAWKIIKAVANWIVGAMEWVVSRVEKLISKIIGPIGKVAGFLLHAGGSVIGDIGGFLGLGGGGSSHPTSSPVTPSSSSSVVYLPRGNYVAPNAAPAAAGGFGQVPLEATIHNYTILDGKVTSKSIVRQGLMAQARRGGGGPTISDAG